MVKFINIIALNDKGKIAIDKHIYETLKTSRIKKMVLKKMGYKQMIINENPYTLRIEVNNPFYSDSLQLRDFEIRIKEALKLNGADDIDDYILEGE